MKLFKNKDKENRIPLADYPFIYYPYWVFVIIIGPFIINLILNWFFPDIKISDILNKISAGGIAFYIGIEILRAIKIFNNYDSDPKNHSEELLDMYGKLQLFLGAFLIYFLQKVFHIFG